MAKGLNSLGDLLSDWRERREQEHQQFWQGMRAFHIRYMEQQLSIALEALDKALEQLQSGHLTPDEELWEKKIKNALRDLTYVHMEVSRWIQDTQEAADDLHLEDVFGEST